MDEPTFWRTEVWHPLSVHFPIAVLLLATIAKGIALLVRGDKNPFWQRAGSYLLYLGFVTAWAAIYTGDMADGIVSRNLCDPTVLKDHEIAAYNVAYLFSAATALTVLLNFRLIKIWPWALQVLVLVLMLIGSGYLTYAAHLGARVVYEQAGGVTIPTADCAGF